MSRLNQLRSAAVRTGFNSSRSFTVSEVESLARRLHPTMRFHHEENFFPMRPADLVTPGVGDVDLDVDGVIGRRTMLYNPGVVPVASVDSAELTGRSRLTNTGDDDALFRAKWEFPTSSRNRLLGTNDGWRVGTKTAPMTPATVVTELRFVAEAYLQDLVLYRDGDLTDDEKAVLQPGRHHTDPVRGPIDWPDGRDNSDAQLEEGIKVAQQIIDGDAPAQPAWMRDDFFSSLSNHAFLEFYFYYPYNDLSSHNHELFTGDHEGDVEAAALVLSRDALIQIDQLDDAVARQTQLDAVNPTHLLVAAHSSINSRDERCALPAAGPHQVPLWIAAGSHAASTTPSTEATLQFVDDGYVPALLAGPIVLSVWALFDFLFFPEDERSDSGYQPSPAHPDGAWSRDGTNLVTHRLHHTDGIYDDENQAARTFPGSWAYDGDIYSRPKTGRFIDILHD